MRSLVQPAVLRASALAAALSGLACWPRLALWTERRDAIGFLLAVVAVCAFFLWNFVLGWHERYAQRPVFARVEPKLWGRVTALALMVAVVIHFAGDPFVRPLAPEEFPNDLATWAAMLLFGVGFGSVFLVFAPFAFFVRLTRRVNWSAAGTVLLGVLVVFLKAGARAEPLPAGWLAALMLARAVGAAWVVWLYLRGGAGLVWWCGAVVQARHLIEILAPGRAAE
ncbi:MAG: hypothetical protein HY300_13470 [Verrucomicrobia bacterium]|nr:hypothetical protein [Verrucomicrobiota bacterium]